MLDLRNAPKLQGFDFNKMHEGIVVDNSQFQCKGKIKVVLPELFIGKDDKRIISYIDTIDFGYVVNSNELKFESSINHVNYIDCYPILLNGLSVGSHKPNVGDTVMVYFINGDVKNTYYLNAHLLKEDEPIVESSNDVDYIGYGYYRIIKIKKKAMTGADVHQVGTKLKILGYNVAEDTRTGSFKYDEAMVQAIKRFQKRVNIKEDGIVGPITFRMLMSFRKTTINDN